MIAKVTKDVFNESSGNRILETELEKNKRIKTYFKENDRTPNTDGYFEVLDCRSIALKRFVVQIKTVRKLKCLRNGDYSYSADTAFFQFVLESIDENPAVFFIVDLSSGNIYYKFLSLEYLLSLAIGHKVKVAIHLNSSDTLAEGKFYNFCISLIKERMVELSSALTEAMLPSTFELYPSDSIASTSTNDADVMDVTWHYSYFPMPVGPEEGRFLRIPREILHKYEDIKLLGAGGTSKVFSLTSKFTGSKVALKVAQITAPSARLLLNEYKILDQLRNPAIPRAIDYFAYDETEYMIMDLIDGQDLQSLTRRGVFNLAEIILILCKLCDVIDFLYLHGVIHRDIKPSNIMISSSYSITLLDFDTATKPNEASQYTFIGTLRYAAPETYYIDYKSKIASSIFSIGATLYYSLINDETRPFLLTLNSSLELVEYIANYVGDELGSGLGILKKALAFDPKKRYSSVRELHDDLMIWQKVEFSNPSILNVALERSKDRYANKIAQLKVKG